MIQFTNIYEFFEDVVDELTTFYFTGTCSFAFDPTKLYIPVADDYNPTAGDIVRVYGGGLDQNLTIQSVTQVGADWECIVSADPIYPPATYTYEITTKTIKYMYGHHKEIQKRLIEMGKGSQRDNKYPLIILFLDIEETRDPDPNTVVVYRCNLAIVDQTDTNYTAAERLENVFEPILWEIYDDFMDILKENLHYFLSKSIPHTKFDRFFWSTEGAGEQNVLAAQLDAVEIIGLDVTVLKSMLNC